MLFPSLITPRLNKIIVLQFCSSYLIKIFLFGSDKFNLTSIKTILSSVINFIYLLFELYYLFELYLNSVKTVKIQGIKFSLHAISKPWR